MTVEAPDASAQRLGVSALLAGLVLIVVSIVLLWYAPGSYSIYKALHVVAIVIWVGGDVTLTGRTRIWE